MRTNPIKVVGAVILDEEKKMIFVGQRSRYGKNPLKWEFIGGKVENGEDLSEAVEREFFEETGLKILAEKIVGESSFDYGGEIGEVKVYFVKCKKFKGDPTIDKNVYEKADWIELDKLLDLDWIEADRELVKKLAEV